MLKVINVASIRPQFDVENPFQKEGCHDRCDDVRQEQEDHEYAYTEGEPVKSERENKTQSEFDADGSQGDNDRGP